MGAIKRTPADAHFSLCVREAANWTCERCGKYFPEGAGRQGLHCSHFHGRGNWGIRFDPLNAFAHCYGCHMYFQANPIEFTEWVLERIGQDNFDLLLEKKNDRSLAKLVRKTKGKGEISKHYRIQHDLLKQKRAEGDTSKLTFEGWV